jgi:hypothetical protein
MPQRAAAQVYEGIDSKVEQHGKVATTVISAIAVPRRALYAWLVPGVFSHELETVLRDEAGPFPGSTAPPVTTGPWDVAGSTRIVHLRDGTTCRETVKTATAPDYFAYRLTEFSSRMIRMLVREANGQWWFTDHGAGTQAKWTYTAESRSLLPTPLLIRSSEFLGIGT